MGSADRLLLTVIGSALNEAARRAGPHLACRLGCTECCFGPFPINQLDAWRLREGLSQLETRQPARAARIRERAHRAATQMAAAFPGNPDTGLLGGDERAEAEFCERFAALPCPLLDPETGACDLYDARPLSCRTFGLPVRIGGEDLPPCRLCFSSAGQAEVEACRVEVDPDGVEAAILADYEAGGGAAGQTLVAYALLGGAPGETAPV
jgi:Fe-S-cluster containining protein